MPRQEAVGLLHSIWSSRSYDPVLMASHHGETRQDDESFPSILLSGLFRSFTSTKSIQQMFIKAHSCRSGVNIRLSSCFTADAITSGGWNSKCSR